MIYETGFDDTFYYFGNERQIRDWPIVREFFFIQCWFLKQWWDNRFLESGVKLAGDEGRLTILVIVGTRTDEHSLRSQVVTDDSQVLVLCWNYNFLLPNKAELSEMGWLALLCCSIRKHCQKLGGIAVPIFTCAVLIRQRQSKAYLNSGQTRNRLSNMANSNSYHNCLTHFNFSRHSSLSVTECCKTMKTVQQNVTETGLITT